MSSLNRRNLARIVLLSVCTAVAVSCLVGPVTATESPTTGTAAATGSGPGGMNGSGTAADPYVVRTVEQLQAVDEDLDAHYVLGTDIDASGTATWNGGEGFEPVADFDPFTGTLDGQGHAIRGLTINHTMDIVFGPIAENRGRIENLRMVDVNVTGDGVVGGLVGENDGAILNTTVSGTVTAKNSGAGVVGRGEGVVYNVTSTARINVSGVNAGGVVAKNSGEVLVSAASGRVTGEGRVGGLVAKNRDGGVVRGSHANATVSGERSVGGLVGKNAGGTIRTSAATGTVNGSSGVGGLVGSGSGDGRIVSTYATATVTGSEYVGGLVGEARSNVTDVYAAGSVSGNESVGGLLGAEWGVTVTDAYWDETTTGQSDGVAGGNLNLTGRRTTTELTGESAHNTTALDFDAVWTATQSYPERQQSVLAAIEPPLPRADTDVDDPTASETDSSGEDGSTTDSEDTSSDGSGPGFGIAGALAAVAALLGAATRRN